MRLILASSALLICGWMTASGGCQRANASVAASQTAPSPSVPPVASAATTAPADPLAARAHLPMPWRLVGVSFISEEKGEPGWAPGPMADGSYFAEFTTYGLVWRHADVEDHYICTLGKDGAFEAVARDGKKAEGRVDLARGELTWHGKKYRVRTYDEVAKEKADKNPPHPASAPQSPVQQPNKGTLQIDLTSAQKGSGNLGFAMGGLYAEYLGHHAGWAVLRVHTNIEMGEGEMLYRLPISDGTATIQSKNSGRPTYSFDVTKGKRVWGVVSRGGNGVGWTHKKEDFEHPSNTQHYIVDADGKSNALVYTMDMQTGPGAEVRPGAKVRVRVWFYTDRDYLALRPDARQGEEMTFAIGSWKDEKIKAYQTDGVGTAMDGVVRGMKAGGWRQAQLNQVAAQDLEKLVPKMKSREVLYLEVNLLGVEGGDGQK